MSKGKTLKRFAFVIFVTLSSPFAGRTQTENPAPLTQLEPKALIAGFDTWKLAGTIWFDPLKKKKIVKEKGEEILFNEATNPLSPLEVPLGTGGSLYLEFEYMLSADAQLQLGWDPNQGLLLSSQKGQAEVSTTHGALVGRFAYPPRVDASRAAGLWQRARIWLSADGTVYGIALNDVIVHRNIHMPPAEHSQLWRLTFAPKGTTALRNIKYTLQAQSNEAFDRVFDFPTRREIIVSPTEHTIVQRCFIQDSTFKRTYCVAVGDPSGIHYVMDQAQANVLGVWKGEFYDASTMWISRGEPQVAQPLGNIIWFDGKPLLATLDGAEVAWPDSTQQGLAIKGYELDQQRRPVFRYTFGETTVIDRVVPSSDYHSLERMLSITQVDRPNLWLRLAAGQSIEPVGKGKYAIDDMKYYLYLPSSKGIQTRVREINGVAELLVSVTTDTELAYTIYW